MRLSLRVRRRLDRIFVLSQRKRLEVGAVLEHYSVAAITRWPAAGLTGRRKIFTAASEINIGNLLSVLETALSDHAKNAAEIDYLWNYYKGRQDIQFKEKYVRETINEKVTVNRANEIVSFKSAFLLEEPIQYISHGGNETASKQVNALNDMMRIAGKEACDKELVDWFHICGVAPRLAIADPENKDVPFAIYSLDPRKAFVIYHCGLGEKRLAGVTLGKTEDGTQTADVYTKKAHFRVNLSDKTVAILSAPQYDCVPMVEYVNNAARMGSFENVISILNNINLLESNAVDSVEDFVNGFDVFENCEIDDGDYSKLAIGGNAVKVKTTSPGLPARVYRVSSEINQSGVQTRIDDLTAAYLEICGMPNRNGGTSTSDTGTAVIFRDGWSTAVSRAKDTETLFRRSEREFCQIVLNICEVNGVEVPKLSEFEPEFLAHKLSNLQSRVQALCEMLNNPKIHPKHAYNAAGPGVFDDVEAAYRDGMKWMEDNQAKEEAALNARLVSDIGNENADERIVKEDGSENDA